MRSSNHDLAEKAQETRYQEQWILIDRNRISRKPSREQDERKAQELTHVRQVEIHRHHEIHCAFGVRIAQAHFFEQFLGSLRHERYDDEERSRRKCRDQSILGMRKNAAKR